MKIKNLIITLADVDIDSGYVGLFLVIKVHEAFKFNGHIEWFRSLFYFQWKGRLWLDIFFIRLTK